MSSRTRGIIVPSLQDVTCQLGNGKAAHIGRRHVVSGPVHDVCANCEPITSRLQRAVNNCVAGAKPDRVARGSDRVELVVGRKEHVISPGTPQLVAHVIADGGPLKVLRESQREAVHNIGRGRALPGKSCRCDERGHTIPQGEVENVLGTKCKASTLKRCQRSANRGRSRSANMVNPIRSDGVVQVTRGGAGEWQRLTLHPNSEHRGPSR